jgi:hypothetical protein
VLKSQPRLWRRALVGVSAIVLLVLAATPIEASQPNNKPTPKLKVSAVTGVYAGTLNYQVNAGVGSIASQTCYFFGQIGLEVPCDTTPNQGSGAKQTKYSLDFTGLTNVRDYTFQVDMSLIGGTQLTASTTFSPLPGPATHFSVTGLVAQPSTCYVGIDCAGWPPADYPRQIAKITALDQYGNVATGYAGTVSFENPVNHITPVASQTLTNGVGFVPVLVPSLGLGYFEEPFTSSCPSGLTGNGVVLTATDTIDPSIFGCQNIPGGDLNLVFPNGFDPAPSTECLTGCFSEPTNTIIINTNLLTPYILEPTIINNTIVISGETSTNLYFTQPVNTGVISINGSELDLSACTQCNTFSNFLLNNATPIENSNVIVTDTVITFNATGLDPISNSTITLNNVQTVTVNASTPNCFSDSTLTSVVALCGLEP